MDDLAINVRHRTCSQVLSPCVHDKDIIHTDTCDCVDTLGLQLLSLGDEARGMVLAAGQKPGIGLGLLGFVSASVRP